jgi:hypothetical protein
MQRYESLRRNGVLDGGGNRERELLIHRGMGAWIKAWMSCAPQPPLLPPQPVTVGVTPSEKGRMGNLLPEGWEAPLIRILAGMALEVCRREMP